MEKSRENSGGGGILLEVKFNNNNNKKGVGETKQRWWGGRVMTINVYTFIPCFYILFVSSLYS